MAHIKHWGNRYDPVSEHICSEQGCMREAAEFDHGKPKCVAHLTLRLEVRDGTRLEEVPAIRRFRHA